MGRIGDEKGWIVESASAMKIDIRVIRFKTQRRRVGFAGEGEYMSILDQIVETKRQEVAAAKLTAPVEGLKEQIAAMDRPRNFFQAVTTPGKKPVNLIAEVKKASPSAG